MSFRDRIKAAIIKSLEDQRGGYYVEIDSDNDCASLDGNFSIQHIADAVCVAIETQTIDQP